MDHWRAIDYTHSVRAAVRAQVEKAADKEKAEKAADKEKAEKEDASFSTKVSIGHTGSEGLAVRLPRDLVRSLEQLESLLCFQLFFLVPDVIPDTTISSCSACSLDSNCNAGLVVAE